VVFHLLDVSSRPRCGPRRAGPADSEFLANVADRRIGHRSRVYPSGSSTERGVIAGVIGFPRSPGPPFEAGTPEWGGGGDGSLGRDPGAAATPIHTPQGIVPRSRSFDEVWRRTAVAERCERRRRRKRFGGRARFGNHDGEYHESKIELLR